MSWLAAMKSAEYPMNNHCESCGGQLVGIDHYGERLKGCPKVHAGKPPQGNGADLLLTTWLL
jgi:hypothetical protein